MALSEERKRSCARRLLLARTRLLTVQGFYGLLLMHMKFRLEEDLETACTDGEWILFSPEFMEGLSDRELEFVLMHEILHVALQHCFRRGDRDPELFNIACDIVVNSNVLLSAGMDPSSITISQWGVSMHLAPDGHEGYEYTAEEVYEQLLKPSMKKRFGGQGAGQSRDNSKEKAAGRSGKGSSKGSWDDHSCWSDTDSRQKELWAKRLKDAAQAISVRDPSNDRGLLPLCAARLLKALTAPQTDWRTVLNEFVQEDLCDYSFTPPDRRFDGSDFFLPDFNERTDRVEKILFMADTSGSVSDDLLSAAYSEVKGALDQFDGRLSGWLGFFDAKVIPPIPFTDERELLSIRPAGGGGTDFQAVFTYVQEQMEDPPACIVILTDGYAPFPEETEARGIPVLWLIGNDCVTPPWGKTARIRAD